MDNTNGNTGTRRRKYRDVAGYRVLFDEEDFLWHPKDWNEDIARALASKSGMEDLTPQHWQVIEFLRRFYFDNGRAPMNRQLAKGTAMSILTIESLFPGGIRRGARRLAGLPNPKDCL